MGMAEIWGDHVPNFLTPESGELGRGRRSRWSVRTVAAVVASATLALTGMAGPAMAAPVSVHEITANWTGIPVPTTAPYAQPVTAEWHVNTNDLDDPYSN